MLGRALCEELSAEYEVVGLDVFRLHAPCSMLHAFIQCDITDREKTIAEVASVKPDIVIHTAAYTDVDGCEQNPEKARRVNARGTETIALACQNCGAPLCYISTDFVFDGEKKSAYVEADKPNPVNVYGKSKLDGETFVQSILKDFIIVRSSWLFGKGGKNFVDTFLDKAKAEKRLKVVNDQFGCPTYAPDLARAIKALLSALSFELSADIYHITNSGSCCWYEFAQAVKEIANLWYGISKSRTTENRRKLSPKAIFLDIDIAPVSTEQYHSPARRPKLSILNNSKFEKLTGKQLPHWQNALKKYLTLL